MHMNNIPNKIAFKETLYVNSLRGSNNVETCQCMKQSETALIFSWMQVNIRYKINKYFIDYFFIFQFSVKLRSYYKFTF